MCSCRLTSDRNRCTQVINSIGILNGVDIPESQLDALFHGMTDPAVGWSDWRHDDPMNPTARIIILATDADYHKPGDTSLTRHSGTHGPARCTQQDYPSVAQIRTALLSKKAVPLFLITDVQSKYRSLLTQLGVGGSVQTLSRDSSNVVAAIKSVSPFLVAGDSSLLL